MQLWQYNICKGCEKEEIWSKVKNGMMMEEKKERRKKGRKEERKEEKNEGKNEGRATDAKIAS